MKKPIKVVGPGPRSRQRTASVDFDANGVPLVEHLTGTEARAVLREALTRLRAAENQRSQMVQLIATIAYDRAMPTIVAADGTPPLPMRIGIPRAVVLASERPWQMEATMTVDELVIEVTEAAAPGGV